MVYLKTYFYVEHEIRWLELNLRESADHVDKFIICEFNVTHTGMPRKFIGINKLLKNIENNELKEKIIYLPLDISKVTVEAYNDENKIHQINEPIMRSAFMKAHNFNDDDIIFSIDADEIIYNHMYPELIEFISKHETCLLNLHQFFYKPTYLWENKDFIAPIGIKYKKFKDRYPCNLRYEGILFPKKAGCHFSWCMNVNEMLYKLDTYSHPRYRSLAKKNILENAIKEKTYPFDPSVDFNIKEININSNLLPSSMRHFNNYEV